MELLSVDLLEAVFVFVLVGESGMGAVGGTGNPRSKPRSKSGEKGDCGLERCRRSSRLNGGRSGEGENGPLGLLLSNDLCCLGGAAWVSNQRLGGNPGSKPREKRSNGPEFTTVK